MIYTRESSYQILRHQNIVENINISFANLESMSRVSCAKDHELTMYVRFSDSRIEQRARTNLPTSNNVKRDT